MLDPWSIIGSQLGICREDAKRLVYKAYYTPENQRSINELIALDLVRQFGYEL